MARTASWLNRLHEIRKSVDGSVRSHYTRAELEGLFLIQARAASDLMRMMPRTPVGTAHVVKSEDLAEFLDLTRDAEDVTALFGRLKGKHAGVERRKLRSMVRRDVDPMNLYGIPGVLTIKRGEMKLVFRTMEELVQALVTLAAVLDGDLDEFARLYEPTEEREEPDSAVEDVAVMFAENEAMRLAKGLGRDFLTVSRDDGKSVG